MATLRWRWGAFYRWEDEGLERLGLGHKSHRIRTRPRSWDIWCSFHHLWCARQAEGLSGWPFWGKWPPEAPSCTIVFGKNQGEWVGAGARVRSNHLWVEHEGPVASEQIWCGFCSLEFSRLNAGNATQTQSSLLERVRLGGEWKGRSSSPLQRPTLQIGLRSSGTQSDGGIWGFEVVM